MTYITWDADGNRIVRPGITYIVAEVSKNWFDGQTACPTISELFETVIEHNRMRGYVLHSFQLHQIMTAPTNMTETIVAVFQRGEG